MRLAVLVLMLAASSGTAIAQPNGSATSAINAVADSVGFSDAYTLSPGDRVRIDFFKVTQYSGENQVLVDGTLNLPQVGYVSVQGMTLKEAADAISAQYATVLRYPFVTVNLLAPAPVKVGVSGEVNRPGSYTIPTADSGGSQLPSVTRAIQVAGGITQIANLRQVEVRRPLRSGLSVLSKLTCGIFFKLAICVETLRSEVVTASMCRRQRKPV
jgi:polysaccharide export outer membrane protein